MELLIGFLRNPKFKIRPIYKVEGIRTSVELHQRILDNEEFQSGQIDTHFMERFLAED